MLDTTKPQPWTSRETELLESLYTAGVAWSAIADRTGRTEGACRTKLSEIRKQRLKAERCVGRPSPPPLKQRLNRKKWTTKQIDTLLTMAETFERENKRPHWREVSEATGHHESSCRLKYNAIMGRAGDLKLREEIDRKIAARQAQSALKAPPLDEVPLKPIVDNPEFGRTTSTDKLRLDAELRARIEILGATGGLLGDPLPGRSALDMKRAGLTP